MSNPILLIDEHDVLDVENRIYEAISTGGIDLYDHYYTGPDEFLVEFLPGVDISEEAFAYDDKFTVLVEDGGCDGEHPGRCRTFCLIREVTVKVTRTYIGDLIRYVVE